MNTRAFERMMLVLDDSLKRIDHAPFRWTSGKRRLAAAMVFACPPFTACIFYIRRYLNMYARFFFGEYVTRAKKGSPRIAVGTGARGRQPWTWR